MTDRHMMKHIWSQDTLPPRGVSFLGGFQIKIPEEEGPPLKIALEIDQLWGLFFRGGPLPPGSSFGNTQKKRHPPGGGVPQSE